MHHRIIHFHHDRKWARTNNHMDARHCPHCHATVHGDEGQKKHQQWHIDQAEHEDRLAQTIEQLCKRTGITEESVELPWTWIAVVEDDQEAISG